MQQKLLCTVLLKFWRLFWLPARNTLLQGYFFWLCEFLTKLCRMMWSCLRIPSQRTRNHFWSWSPKLEPIVLSGFTKTTWRVGKCVPKTTFWRCAKEIQIPRHVENSFLTIFTTSRLFQEPPYMMLKKNSAFLTGNDRFEGYVADMIARLAAGKIWC